MQHRWAQPPPDPAAAVPVAPAAPCRKPKHGVGRRDSAGRQSAQGATVQEGGEARGSAGQGGALLFELKLAVLDPRQPPRLVPLALGEADLRLKGRSSRRRSVGGWKRLRLLVGSDPSRDGQPRAERRPALRPRPDSPDEGGRSPAEQW